MDDPTPTVAAPSKPPRRFRRTRLAVSVFFGVVAISLCVLWVRSYLRMEQIIHRNSPAEYAALTSMPGQILFGKSNDPTLQVFKDKWTTRGFAMKDWDAALSGPVAYFPANRNYNLVPMPGFSRMPFVVTTPGTYYSELTIPYWLPVLFLAAASYLPWIQPRRFSLRTLLIATTLVAVVLGLGVWLGS